MPDIVTDATLDLTLSRSAQANPTPRLAAIELVP